MRRTKAFGILVGVGLLGASTLLSLSQPASAAPRRNVKAARGDVKEARRDVKVATKQVREERQDLNRAQRNLRNAQQDLRKEQQDLRRVQSNRRDNNRRYSTNDRNARYRYNTNSRYQPNHRYSANRRYVTNNRYNTDRRYINNNRRDFRTLDGIVTNDLRGDAFALRANNGRHLRVVVRGNEPRRISRGDRVRVHGYSDNGIFRAQSVSILRNR
jgi:predicted RNase H-like nuclease (RuvC/YqgF family)